jgi:hypothetical protein
LALATSKFLYYRIFLSKGERHFTGDPCLGASSDSQRLGEKTLGISWNRGYGGKWNGEGGIDEKIECSEVFERREKLRNGRKTREVTGAKYIRIPGADRASRRRVKDLICIEFGCKDAESELYCFCIAT